MREARLERTEYGTSAATEGWFAVNLRDAAWVTNDDFGAACIFEGEAVPFAQVGYTVAVLQPGQPNGMYHREDDQEDFLVLSGECILIVEGEERRLKAWDFVHCPAGTEHIFVGAGDGPCVIFMAGGARAPGQRGLPTQRGRVAPPRRRRGGYHRVEGGVRALCEVAARSARAPAVLRGSDVKRPT
ncbi:MAG: cupin domain-containing protein [Solirubrobacteraceae bacterium]